MDTQKKSQEILKNLIKLQILPAWVWFGKFWSAHFLWLLFRFWARKVKKSKFVQTCVLESLERKCTTPTPKNKKHHRNTVLRIDWNVLTFSQLEKNHEKALFRNCRYTYVDLCNTSKWTWIIIVNWLAGKNIVLSILTILVLPPSLWPDSDLLSSSELLLRLERERESIRNGFCNL